MAAAAAAASSTLLRPSNFSSARPVSRSTAGQYILSRSVVRSPVPSSVYSCSGSARRPAVVRTSAAGTGGAPAAALPAALLFDCDGVLVDTEKDGHRISFNETFAEKELGVSWDVELYGELLKIGGGKERMTAYFNKTGWPTKAPKTDEERKEFIASLHKRKTEIFMALIEKKLLPLRPGPDRAEKITIFAGDVVPRKKPDPAIYTLAATTLGVDPSSYTAEEDFAAADAVFDCIGDPPEVRFDLDFCANLLQKQYVS
ncbi:hypothetical protein PR202_ga24443 [Eleusine coracana subsp. coracana]|uniref:Uncharacterized protein n=1 Tax=Eleusine coracana subsp. coracana TaxID=191504 RepID=A0AAV5D992_ELECO|nr:hypothetical protein PR202_ga24443 [Eleusine coracana subsp. coracana]